MIVVGKFEQWQKWHHQVTERNSENSWVSFKFLRNSYPRNRHHYDCHFLMKCLGIWMETYCKLEIILWTAYNWTGLCASVIQSCIHVAYGPRGMTTTEQKYSQLEKETLKCTIYFVRLTEILSICLWKKNSCRDRLKPI